MMRLLPLALLVPTLLMAQASDPASTDTIFVRAQRMVAEGQGDAGRALVQQQLDAAPAGSPKYVEALYWRAALASTAADAERDLKRIVIEYALSPRADDALMRLAQLEMARGDRDQALAHLQRVVSEHPNSPSRARASYWMARTLFEQKKDVPGCARLTDARSNAAAGDVELRNQIDYYAPRCEGMDAANATAATAAPTAAPPNAVPSTGGTSTAATPMGGTPTSTTPTSTTPTGAPPTPSANTATPSVSAVTPSGTLAAPPPTAPAPAASPPPATTASSGPTSEPPPQLSVPTPARPDVPAAMPRKSEPGTSPPAAAAPPTPRPVTAPPKASSPGTPPAKSPPTATPTAPASATPLMAYTVQVGAYNTHAEAVALQARLRTRGIETRVAGTQRPFRVRIGRYSTQAAANAEAVRLKASKIDCFVTEAEAP